MQQNKPDRKPMPHGTAASLYTGNVMHARLRPMGHRFNYRVMSLLIDLDRLDDANRLSKLFGVNRRALYSFHESDHGPRDGSSLSAYARKAALAQGIDLTGGRIALLCYPRLLGFVFNPLSVYFCRTADGRLALLIYEVRNTFGDIHHYVLPVDAAESDAPVVHQRQSKQFYVSPFIEHAMTYLFRVAPPADNVQLRILETDAEGPLLAATFSGRRKPLTTRALTAAFIRLPLMPLKIVAAIHWEALRLWLKGAKLVPRLQPTASEANASVKSRTKRGLSAVRH